MSDYKLSIIIPTYNLENEIKDAFNSIKSQTIGFEEIEVIFVDDNSTDNTFKILNDYSDKYDNVKVLKTDENTGYAGHPRNFGLEKSTAEYILFLDGDDQLLFDSCEALLKDISANDSDISIGGQINRYNDGMLEHIPPLTLGQREVFTNTKDLNLFNITPAISAKLFKREFLNKYNIRFAEGIPAQDLVFMVNAILYSKKVSILNSQYIYFRNISRNSVSFNITEKYLYGLIKAYTFIGKLFERHLIDINIQEIVFKRHLGFFATQILRAFHSEDFNNEKLDEILKSDEFNRLSSKVAFKNNEDYSKFFELIRNGKYRDAKNLISNLKLNININTSYLNLKNENESLKEEIFNLRDENVTLRNHNTQLSEENNQKNNELFDLQKEFDELKLKTNDLKKSNNYLSEENNNLKTELDEIKSSKLWKLTNKF